jgi:hypothetical protein
VTAPLSRLAEDQPGTVSGYIPPVRGGRPEPATAAQDWRAMREQLTRLCAAAQEMADNADPLIFLGFYAQVELCSVLLDFMDERERANTAVQS